MMTAPRASLLGCACVSTVQQPLICGQGLAGGVRRVMPAGIVLELPELLELLEGATFHLVVVSVTALEPVELPLQLQDLLFNPPELFEGFVGLST